MRGIILISYFQTKLNSEVEGLNKSQTVQLSTKTRALKVWMRIPAANNPSSQNTDPVPTSDEERSRKVGCLLFHVLLSHLQLLELLPGHARHQLDDYFPV
jgi:hypothetical protein